jgi:glutamine synthetase adenylyltransferase
MKRYTYRTQADIDASLNAKGVSTHYTVLLAGVTTPQATNYTLEGARYEVDSHLRVNGTPGMVLCVPTGEIVYTVA